VKAAANDQRWGASPLTMEELETGLRMLGRGGIDQNEFWDANIDGFRQTVVLAIRETSAALQSREMTLRWRTELEAQLPALVQYLELADRYIARRARRARLRCHIN
jgi:hypothetical protein